MQNSCCNLTSKEVENLANPGLPDDLGIRILKTIGHPLRLKILRLLLNQQELCTCDLISLFNEQQPIITKQLAKLKEEELIIGRKITFSKAGRIESKLNGKWTAYRINPDKYDFLRHLLSPFSSSPQGRTENKYDC
ncbi:MAG: ArsR family transcriptional regulator [Candidatus Hodarchaeales archaeon]|jgi:ArsR family transcriptional regulator